MNNAGDDWGMPAASSLVARRGSRGFTLIEVLLALTILALVLTVIYQSFSNAGEGIRQAEEVRDGTDTARTLLARLTADLSNAYVNGRMSETFFFGKKSEDDVTKKRFDSIALTTLTNFRRPGTAETELWEVGYYFQERPEDKKRVLYRREKRELSKDVPPLEGGIDYELTDAIEELRIRYSSDGANWKDDWEAKQLVPRSVEVLLTLDDGRVYGTRIDMPDIRYQ